MPFYKLYIPYTLIFFLMFYIVIVLFLSSKIRRASSTTKFTIRRVSRMKKFTTILAHCYFIFPFFHVPPTGFEPVTPILEVLYSIQLSYGGILEAIILSLELWRYIKGNLYITYQFPVIIINSNT